jgi:tetratricopeptide (TPR) repeat protein
MMATLTMRANLRRHLVLLAILLAYAVSLGRTVDYGYVWDDIPEIAQDPSFDRPLVDGLRLTQVARGAGDLAHLDQIAFSYDSYRPLLYATLWLDIRVWGRAAGPLHRTNVVLGALAILVAFATARRWVGNELAWIPTAVFALHPAQIETVAYISARGDLLAGLFALATTYAVLRAAATGSTTRAVAWTFSANVAYAASLLSKESYLLLPIVLAAIVHSHSHSHGRTRWWAVASLALTASACLGLRSVMLAVEARPALGDALAAGPGLVVDYLRIAAFPFDLSIERAPRTTVAAGWIVVAGAAFMAGVYVIRGRRGLAAVRDELLGIGWMVLLIAPSLIAARTMHVIADRYLYAPLFGLAIAATFALARLVRMWPQLRLPLLLSLVPWGLALVFVGWRQVPVWTDTSSLYVHAQEMVPESARANYRVAVLAIHDDDWKRAVPLLQRAIELAPTYAEALNNLGVYELRRGRAAQAEDLLQRAVTANPARFNAWNNLGLAQLAQGRPAEACRSIARAMSVNPGYEAARREHDRHCGGKLSP